MIAATASPYLFLRSCGRAVARCTFAAGLLTAAGLTAFAQNAFVRVSQVGYEAGNTSRAYLMSKVSEDGATFTVSDAKGNIAYSGSVGAMQGNWVHSASLNWKVYALDFQVPRGDRYTIAVTGPAKATSPVFAVQYPETLYPSLLVNSLFFYQTQRDGQNYIPNALRSAPGHLKDKQAQRFVTPPLDADDNINNTPPTPPLVSSNLPDIDASGGWWDAGDYIKYVETVSYTAGLMETGVRDFPSTMGRNAALQPVAAPNAISYAGTSGTGAPKKSDFSDEARFGVEWLLKMWDRHHQALSLQVDNSQEWNYYGGGDTASTACGGSYSSPYCLLTEYDIWVLPQAMDNYQSDGDPQPCDPYTTVFLCNRPVFQAGAPGTKISPNLAGRLAATFALCYSLHRKDDSAFGKQCLTAAQQVYALADTSFADPSPFGGKGSLTTAVPFDGYGETTWEDDMEWGATELAIATYNAKCDNDSSAVAPGTSSEQYLSDAARFASGYIKNIYKTGAADTLNLYDVSGLAHFELVRAMKLISSAANLSLSPAQVREQLVSQVEDAISTAKSDPWGFGESWSGGDVTSHGAGLSVMASEAYSLTGDNRFDLYSRRWLGNILGANAWGSSFIVGDGTTFPNCIQHQVANIAGALNGTAGGTPVLWGAAVEGPSAEQSSGLLDGMRVCPADGKDEFATFNGSPNTYDKGNFTRYKDDVQSYSTTEPAVDLTATSFLMWSWRLAQPAAF